MFSYVTADRDLFYRMNRWAGTPEKGIPTAFAGDLAGIDWFPTANDQPAEGAYARDGGPGSDAAGTVKCGPPPPGAKCTLTREKGRRDDEDPPSALRTGKHPATGRITVDGWDIQYTHMSRAWGFFEHIGELRVCIKATFKCEAKYTYVLVAPVRQGETDEEFKARMEEPPVRWDLGSLRSADTHKGSRMFGGPTEVPERGCGCDCCSQAERTMHATATWTLRVAARDRLLPGDAFWGAALLRENMIRSLA